MALQKIGRSKKKGKKPSKREQANMLALKELGKGTYQIAAAMGRSPHTIRKYCQSPLFTDPKFRKLVDEYREKELIDVTALTMVARSRLHELAPTMTAIEACAVADRAFHQGRLIAGKSTENVFSLRKIITEAHEARERITSEQKASDAGREIRTVDSGEEPFSESVSERASAASGVDAV